jgi:hypothetical protein
MINYFRVEKNILYIKEKRIEFDYDIIEVLEFDTSIVIYIAPVNKKDYEEYNQKYSWKNKKGPVWGISKDGEFLWQWETGYINSIRKGETQAKIILPSGFKGNNTKKSCLILNGDNWVFYVNPQTGEKICEEQTK